MGGADEYLVLSGMTALDFIEAANLIAAIGVAAIGGLLGMLHRSNSA